MEKKRKESGEVEKRGHGETGNGEMGKRGNGKRRYQLR
jgi:hypothetical protein